VQTDELLYTGMPVDRVARIIPVDEELIDWKKKDEKVPGKRISHLNARLEKWRQC